MTCLCRNQQELLTNLDLAFALALKSGDREVQQFVMLERPRHARVLKKSVSIAVSGSPVASVAKCTPISTETKGSFAKLTKSQLEVVKRMASGDTIKGIALDLGLSESTVEYHFHHARDRIGFRSIAHVTQWALKNHLIDFTI